MLSGVKTIALQRTSLYALDWMEEEREGKVKGERELVRWLYIIDILNVIGS